ncbi:MAG TPA: hydrolase [Gemmatimonadaceae bacterium]|nr:hydrolase [Gemmatimonadaceae bacterium]
MPPRRAFVPAWWIPGPHAQTLWGKLFRRVPSLPLRHERWDTPDGDFVDLHRLETPGATTRLVLLHGLEGGTQSHYVHGTLDQARRRGWHADLLVFRSCGPEPNRARRFYHSGETEDLSLVVDRLVAERPREALVLAGVSLGGNVLLKYLGERGDAVPAAVRAAAAVSVPFDLGRGSRHISRGFSRVYERHFLRTLRRKALAKLTHYPDLYDPRRLATVRTMLDFDDVVTAPVHGFASADDYYERSSALRFLHAVRRPTLLLSAVDDPFLPAAVLDEVRRVAAGNRCLEIEFPPHGGHAGFIAGRVPWRPLYYAEWRIVDFLARQLARAAAGDAGQRAEGADTRLAG